MGFFQHLRPLDAHWGAVQWSYEPREKCARNLSHAVTPFAWREREGIWSLADVLSPILNRLHFHLWLPLPSYYHCRK
jgi:hypothetical protein